ncbi:U3 small nucleolar RNA-interacting protein 2 [Lamellibrachia satsuma]|nr:U3 small nucleolar RNA-interacting protein 2 [Lamellibrachia satsuma]
MPFFIKNKRKASSESKKKTGGKHTTKDDLAKRKKPRKVINDDEEILSDEDGDSGEDDPRRNRDDVSTSEDEDIETAQEKRLRIAKEYLLELKAEEQARQEERDEEEVGHDPIAQRLKQDIKDIAKDYSPPTAADIRVLRAHQLSVTCVVITPDDRFLFSGSKDCSIIKWSVETGKRVQVIPGGRKGTEAKHVGHTSHVLCLAVTSDGRFLGSGDRNKLIHIWKPDTCELLHTFRGHRDAVSGLAFRKGSHQLFSVSNDKTVKIWNVSEMAYVETLYGHQDTVTAVDSLSRERAVTSGGRDGSVRIWKVIEESQLVFHGHTGSIDCVSLINEEHFISGADDNSIALWSVLKKKPLVTVRNAHPGDVSTTTQENWITSVASLQHTNLLASAGSKDGCIRLWECSRDFRHLKPLFTIPLVGFINCLKFSSNGQLLVAGVGQEHKLGRWWSIKPARNSVVIIKLPKNAQTDTNKLQNDTPA